MSLPAEQNESTAFSESLRGGRAHLLAISKTGSRAYPRVVRVGLLEKVPQMAMCRRYGKRQH